MTLFHGAVGKSAVCLWYLLIVLTYLFMTPDLVACRPVVRNLLTLRITDNNFLFKNHSFCIIRHCDIYV